MTYEALLQQQPPSTAAGDRALAREFVSAISAFMAGVAWSSLDASQRNYLYKLRQKWNTRADGQDDAWNQYGSTPGRRRKLDTSGVDKTAYGGEGELDPLLAETMRKYGTPNRSDDI